MINMNRGTARLDQLRYLTAALAAAAALIYFLIGFRAVSVIEPTSDQMVFGLMAGSTYALGAALLLVLKRRSVWILGAALQVFVILQNFNVASERTPAYEIWGVVLRVIQVMMFIGLAYLIARHSIGHADGGDQKRTVEPPLARGA